MAESIFQTELVLGDKVDLHLYRGPYYRTVIEEITPDGFLTMPVPTYRGISIILRLGQKLVLIYYRENGKYEVDMVVQNIIVEGNIRQVILRIISEARKEQRRENYRLPVTLRTLLCHFPETQIPVELAPDDEAVDEIVYTKDLSSTGVLLKTRGKYELGERVLINLYLNWPKGSQAPLPACAAVTRVERDAVENRYLVGLQFLDIYDKQELISRYIVEEQKERLKRR
jgi:c-di-GMP-binding flagellar brake protein YcgR